VILGIKIIFIEWELYRYPDRMIKATPHFQLKLEGVSGQNIKIHSVSITRATYKDWSEGIEVWERKYHISRMKGDYGEYNPDGPKEQSGHTIRDYHRDNLNSGQFASKQPWNLDTLDGSYTAFNKMTRIYMKEVYDEDERIDMDITNLLEKEYSEQMEVYKRAEELSTNNSFKYRQAMPPYLETFLVDIGKSFDVVGFTELRSDLITWDNSLVASEYQEPERGLIQPGGHYYVWSDRYRESKCYIIGPVETVFETRFVHHLHGGEDLVANPYESYVGWVRYDYMQGRSENDQPP
jgi:hypothetical protein